MRATLRDRYRDADQTARARLLEPRTLRFYRIRDLTEPALRDVRPGT